MTDLPVDDHEHFLPVFDFMVERKLGAAIGKGDISMSLKEFRKIITYIEQQEKLVKHFTEESHYDETNIPT